METPTLDTRTENEKLLFRGIEEAFRPTRDNKGKAGLT